MMSVAIIEGSSGKYTQAHKEPWISKSHTTITSLSQAVAIAKERSPSVQQESAPLTCDDIAVAVLASIKGRVTRFPRRFPRHAFKALEEGRAWLVTQFIKSRI